VVKRKLPSLNNIKGNFRADLKLGISELNVNLLLHVVIFARLTNCLKMLFNKFF